jgi:hypothetical protein
VLYGDPADSIEDLGLDDDQGLSSMASMPVSNMSAGRRPDGVDTDDNAVDFTTNMPLTPGETNVLLGADGEWSSSDTGEDWDLDDTKSGCMGCASTRTRPNIWWCVFPILAFARRRRLAATIRS